jgi:hypothetical protein
MGSGELLFDFVDVNGEKPDDRLDVSLTHTVLGTVTQVRDAQARNRLRIRNLECMPGGGYSVTIMPMRHLPVGRFVQVTEGKTVRCGIVLPVDPRRVVKAEFPDFDSCGKELQQVLSRSDVEGAAGLAGAALYASLDDLRKAGLLNIYTRMKATRFPGGRDAFSYVTSFTRIRGDRLFARVDKELRDEVKNSLPADLFHEVPGSLHVPPPGFCLTDSFKTMERYGNLQITFFNNPDTLEFIADVDIDDAQGIEHIFQVVGNAVTGGETHPYNIHEILIGYQKLDPGYRLLV